MIEGSPDFEAYRALDPTARMQARLTGLAEVIDASGQFLLREVDTDMQGAPAAVSLETGEQAFGEGPGRFQPKSSGPVLSDAQVEQLANRLDVTPLSLRAALKDIQSGQDGTG